MNDGDDSDRLLVERYLRYRDESSFLSLYERHSKALFHLSLGLTGSADTAGEIVQETWLRAARGLSGFRWSSSLRTWLSGIAVNCCHELRRRNDEHPLREPDSVSGGAVPETRVDLLRAVRDLPSRSKAVLVLHEILGHTHAEIAHMLEIDPGTSKSQLSYAKQRMREWFDRRERKGETDVE